MLTRHDRLVPDFIVAVADALAILESASFGATAIEPALLLVIGNARHRSVAEHFSTPSDVCRSPAISFFDLFARIGIIGCAPLAIIAV